MPMALRALTIVLGLIVAGEAGVRAWSFDVHRYVTGLAIDRLSGPLGAFLAANRSFVVEHSIDPDLWRTAGWMIEPPRHFLDLDAYGKPPFAALPRDYEAARAKFGRATLDKYGTLPWRTEEVHRDLIRAFAQVRSGRNGYARENVKFFTAILAHYVADAHVPFHAVLNYDGQLTGQHGIHSRFEGELFDRLGATLSVPAPSVTGRVDAGPLVFDALLSGFALVPSILDADRAAIGERETYDDRYFTEFGRQVRPVLQERLGQAASAVASLVLGAWEEGGRPVLDAPAPAARRRAPGVQPD
jgi:hypothetical protein